MPEFITAPRVSGVKHLEPGGRNADWVNGVLTSVTVAAGDWIIGEVGLRNVTDPGDWLALDLEDGARMVLGGRDFPNFVSGTIYDAAGTALLELGTLRDAVGFVVPDGAAFLGLTTAEVTTRFNYGGHPHEYGLIFQQDVPESLDQAQELKPLHLRSGVLSDFGVEGGGDIDTYLLNVGSGDRVELLVEGLKHGSVRLVDAAGAVLTQGAGDTFTLSHEYTGAPIYAQVFGDAAAGFGNKGADVYDLTLTSILTETADAPSDSSTPYTLFGGGEFHGRLTSRTEVDRIKFEAPQGQWVLLSLYDDRATSPIRKGLELWDDKGRSLLDVQAQYWHWGSGGEASLLVHVQEDTTFFLDVKGLGARGAGDYRLTMTLSDEASSAGLIDASYVRFDGALEVNEGSGTDGQDVWIGGQGDDIFDTNYLQGDDRFEGRGGDDRLLSGVGNDQLLGGAGNDLLMGRKGDDRLDGGNGHDRLYGGDHDDRLIGWNGYDRLFGGDGADRLFGGAGQDRLEGGAGDDVLAGGIGADRFVFTVGARDDRPSLGHDVIRDFELAEDMLQLKLNGKTGRQVSEVADLADYARVLNSKIVFDFDAQGDLHIQGVTDLEALLARVDLL